MDKLHQHTLVLEDVTLRFLVQRVVTSETVSACINRQFPADSLPRHKTDSRERYSQVLVNLARIPVLPQQSSEHPLPPHPLHLGRHTSLSSTLPLTGTSMPSLPLRSQKHLCASARVHSGGLDDHTAILDEFLDMCTRVGVADLSLLSRIEPDFAFADAGDAGGEAFLRTEVD